jgi:transcriptional regulator with XRE-family HTH domain
LDDVARDRVRAWMTARGWNQTVLAKQLHRSPAWVSRYLQGGFNLELTMLGRIARIFDHDLAALIRTSPADRNEAQLVAGYRAMDQRARRVVLDFAKLWLRGSAPPAPLLRRTDE